MGKKMNWKNTRCVVANARPDPRLVELEKDLRGNDWSWYMSDDPSVYQAGQTKTANLWARARSLGDAGRKLYDKYKQ